MPVFAVPKDTLDLLVSAALLRSEEPDTDASADLVILADKIGQELWDENHAALSIDLEREVSAPSYRWRPVFELAEFSITDAEVLQVERCRRFLLEQCRPHSLSPALTILNQLGTAVANRLAEWPLAARGTTVDYLGIEETVEQWRRSDWSAVPVTADAGS